MVFNRLGRGDPVSTFLSLLLWNVGDESKIDLQYWSQQLSYLFIGLIVLGSVRGFLTLMLKVGCINMNKMLFPELVLTQAFAAVKKIFSASRDISFHGSCVGCIHSFHLLGELCGHDASDIASGIQVSVLFSERRLSCILHLPTLHGLTGN